MNNWEKFDGTSLADKEDAFYSNLNLKGITYVAYRHAEIMHREFAINNLGDHQDFYVQSDTLLLADLFVKFRNKCVKIYELHSAHLVEKISIYIIL